MLIGYYKETKKSFNGRLERYQKFSEEDKNKKRQYAGEPYANLSDEFYRMSMKKIF